MSLQVDSLVRLSKVTRPCIATGFTVACNKQHISQICGGPVFEWKVTYEQFRFLPGSGKTPC